VGGIVRRADGFQRRAPWLAFPVAYGLERSALARYPVIGPESVGNVHSLSGRGLPLAVGLATAFLGALGVANAMQNALNEVWSVPFAGRPGFPRNWLRRPSPLRLTRRRIAKRT